ncbi:MAG: lactoylglutathione lyase [Gammaproteobacteria bacterium]|nr:MAG: lactoylglutathione lyase [Gammaproteobacteria bacterium]
MAIRRITYVTVVCHDQEEALAWYTEKFGFEKRQDDTSMPGYRWLTVAPPGQQELEVILFKARDDRERGWVGQGTLWVLEVDDCRATVEELKGRGVKVLSEPQEAPWGVSAVVEDLYGNPYSLLERR